MWKTESQPQNLQPSHLFFFLSEEQTDSWVFKEIEKETNPVMERSDLLTLDWN